MATVTKYKHTCPKCGLVLFSVAKRVTFGCCLVTSLSDCAYRRGKAVIPKGRRRR